MLMDAAAAPISFLLLLRLLLILLQLLMLLLMPLQPAVAIPFVTVLLNHAAAYGLLCWHRSPSRPSLMQTSCIYWNSSSFTDRKISTTKAWYSNSTTSWYCLPACTLQTNA